MPDCTCAPCASGMACDTTTKKCVVPACVGKTCATGRVCDSTGSCVDACLGVTCPKGQTCTTGQCVAVTGGGEPDTGTIDFDTGTIDNDASTGNDAGGTFADDTNDRTASACNCATPGRSTGSTVPLAALALALLSRRRLRSR